MNLLVHFAVSLIKDVWNERICQTLLRKQAEMESCRIKLLV